MYVLRQLTDCLSSTSCLSDGIPPEEISPSTRVWSPPVAAAVVAVVAVVDNEAREERFSANRIDPITDNEHREITKPRCEG